MKPSGHTYKESPRKKSDESAGKTMQYADIVVPYHEDIVKNFPPVISVSYPLEFRDFKVDLIEELDNTHPLFITKHVKEKDLRIHLQGGFRFGTLKKYRAIENRSEGRFNDYSEGIRREFFHNRSSYFDSVSVGGFSVENCVIVGFPNNSIGVEIELNDYCYCSSMGRFDFRRAEYLRSHDNSDLTHYIVYDLVKLKRALKELIDARFGSYKYHLVGRVVEYGERDRFWSIERRFSYDIDADAIAIWLGVSFVKPLQFKHEEEFRLMIIDSLGPGLLDKNADYLDFKDTKISECIVDWGKI
ncbi:hypothetical protein GCM10007904_37380 [Oharaeibacter diazotrophicus]|nr:hypothetical protein GCM10007904_37380 [Oharaeibacter diazotrophicus]